MHKAYRTIKVKNRIATLRVAAHYDRIMTNIIAQQLHISNKWPQNPFGKCLKPLSDNITISARDLQEKIILVSRERPMTIGYPDRHVQTSILSKFN